MKKILFSVSAIVAVAALTLYGTGAFFSDTETSTGNVFTAGAIDLKVDHSKQTYNGVDCKTCSVSIVSDLSNQVVEKNGAPYGPSAAVAVTMTPITSTYWTASLPGATWIWATDPVTQADVDNDTYYVFEKTFSWFGPIQQATLNLGVAADNSYEVYVNGVSVGADTNENNHAAVDTISSVNIANNIVQGVNTLRVKVKNWKQPGADLVNNPGGLLYKLVIDGNCGDSYFKNHCTLFSEKDLTQADHFWMFDDIKPGDSGTNLISLHPSTNDAYVCLFAHGLVDEENTRLPLETAAGDTTAGPGAGSGELSSFLKMMVWEDDGDGVYEGGETVVSPANSPLATGYANLPIAANSTGYVGIAWCAGNQSLVGTTISCDGSGMGNTAQTDQTMLDMTAYAVQQRNNASFDCAAVAASYRQPTPIAPGPGVGN